MNIQKKIRPSCQEEETRKKLLEMFENTPIPHESLLENLELYMRPQRISEILSLQQIYQRILDVHGIILEFGVRWGRHLSTFSAFRSIYEPYNFYREIVGFDTFTGFTPPDEKDGNSDKVFHGSMSVSDSYELYLYELIRLHEMEAPLSHIPKIKLIKGNAPDMLQKYFEEYPETIIAMVYFDMDIYQPTKQCLEILRPHMAKGSILAFDELTHPEFPGESRALKEVFDITQLKIERFATAPYPSFIVL